MVSCAASPMMPRRRGMMGPLGPMARRKFGAFLENAFSDEVLGAARPSSHLMANVLIDLDGDRARVETTALACVTNNPGLVTLRGLHYSDVCEHHADGWQIRARNHRADWEFSAPGQTAGPIAAPTATL